VEGAFAEVEVVPLAVVEGLEGDEVGEQLSVDSWAGHAGRRC
jgi:hypothetical protein